MGSSCGCGDSGTLREPDEAKVEPPASINKNWSVKKRGRNNRPPDEDDDADDAEAFEREMANVVRLRPDPRGRIHIPPSVPSPAPGNRPSADDVEDPGEDFAAPGVDRREIRKLKRGEYVVEDRRDLHGMTAAEAGASLQRFIANSRHRRYRCVCIVHGRGLHSEGKASILKARVRNHLRTHPAVLAYANAPPSDGGAGAVYVLLKKSV